MSTLDKYLFSAYLIFQYTYKLTDSFKLFKRYWMYAKSTEYLHIKLESSRIIFGPSMSFTGFRMLLCVAIWKTHCCFMWMLWKEYREACLPGKDIYRFSIHSIPFKQFERICQLVRILKDKRIWGKDIVLRLTASGYPYDILDLRLLITPLISSNFSYLSFKSRKYFVLIWFDFTLIL
jgi:hypothetical protein